MSATERKEVVDGARLTLAAESPAPAGMLDTNGARRVRAVLGDLVATIGCEVAMLCEPDRTGRPQIVSSFGTGESAELAPPRRAGGSRRGARERADGFLARVLTHERAVLEVLDPDLDSALLTAYPRTTLTRALAAPVRGPADIGGALVAAFAAPPPDLALTLWAAESYAAITALVRRHPGALLGLLDAERIDQLTGAITYDTILHELSREIERAARGGLRLSCCFIDLDRFKRVNDRHGHLHGNGVLRQAAQVLREGVRSGDTIGRYGGDEFVAILPQTSAADARWLSERLRAQLAATRIPSLEQPLTASVGVAEWTPGTTAEQLLNCADEALLAAKSMGGDLVIHRRSEKPRA
jgi:diguanylate cyclase (GGDEF)-like protein